MNEEFFTGTSTSQFISSTASDFAISGNGWGITPNGTTVKFDKKNNMPVKIFFGLMKKKMGILKEYSYKKRIERIEEAIIVAEKQGQIAFSEELIKKLLVLSREAEMWTFGKKIFLDRNIFEMFKSKTKKTVSLTALKNYARPIPESVLKEKKRCDDAKLFDGYAIMHYDDKEAVKETEKEKVERQKDPILFGVVEYSDRLYFVDDWIDSQCNLTLDEIIDKLDLEDEDITLSKKIVI